MIRGESGSGTPDRVSASTLPRRTAWEEFAMLRKSIWAAAVAVALGGSLGAYKLAFAGAAAPVDPTRPDCPGQVVCPLTGELVCRDRCPAAAASADAADVPSCCRGGQE